MFCLLCTFTGLFRAFAGSFTAFSAVLLTAAIAGIITGDDLTAAAGQIRLDKTCGDDGTCACGGAQCKCTEKLKHGIV